MTSKTELKIISKKDINSIFGIFSKREQEIYELAKKEGYTQGYYDGLVDERKRLNTFNINYHN